jgi:filamentous hemagglutinin family protein
MSQFKNSIAQVNVNYPIETVITPMAGENYSRAMIFMNVAQAATYLPGVTSAAAGQLIELDSTNYGELTGGLLKTWLVPFFTKATTVKVGIALFDEDQAGDPDPIPATAPISDVYAAKKMYAYFKFAIAGSDAYNALQVTLSNLCKADPLYSVLWIGTDDGNVLTESSSLMTALTTAESKARVVYNSNSNINGALAQLGATLSVANPTGTPVGNSCDMVAFNTIAASGAVDENGEHVNLNATQKGTCDTQKVGYQTWVGDGTENVVTEGSLYLNGDSVAANWVKAYIEYMCKVKTANFITRMNTFRNNQTYQACLLILTDQVTPFLAFGRLDGFKITAPIFADLPASGDQITVPNAWEATYIDGVRQGTIYGTLYLSQPTR